MWGWLIALAAITGLAVMPLGVSARYDAGGSLVRIIAGPVRLKVFPSRKKDKKEKDKKSENPKIETKEAQAPKQEKEAKTKQAPMQECETKAIKEPAHRTGANADTAAPDNDMQPEEKPDEPEKGGSIADFLPLVQVALEFLGDFRRKLRLDRLELKLILAADDPCDLAVNYGRAWAAVGNLFPMLERAFVIKKRDVEVECDFTSDETLIIARLDLTITLGRLLSLAVRYGIRALVEYFKIKNSRKGGALK